MNIILVSEKQLSENLRWKAEFFYASKENRLSSKYDTAMVKDVAEEINEAQDPELFNDTFNYIGLENVEQITGDISGIVKRNRSDVRSRSKMYISGDILYGRLRPYLRKVLLANSSISPGICSTEFLILRPKKERILPEYLRLIMASQYMTKHLSRLQIGAALPRVSSKDVMIARIPVPSLSIQKTITAEIRSLNAKRYMLREKLSIIQKRLEEIVERAVSK